MESLANAHFLHKPIVKTPAATGQEHPVLLYGDCTGPNWTANIVGRGACREIIILRHTVIPVGMARQVRADPSAYVDSTGAPHRAYDDNYPR